MACLYCELLKSPLYEDALVAVIAPPKPAVIGHLIVVPKKHYAILEEVPDEIVSHCFLVANKSSIVLFDALGGGGTNILVQNGLPSGQQVPHFAIHILPRKEGDSLSFKWQPKKLQDQKMEEVQAALKDECDYIGQPVEEKKEKPEAKKESKEIEYKEDNYLIKQLKRIP